MGIVLLTFYSNLNYSENSPFSVFRITYIWKKSTMGYLIQSKIFKDYIYESSRFKFMMIHRLSIKLNLIIAEIDRITSLNFQIVSFFKP